MAAKKDEVVEPKFKFVGLDLWFKKEEWHPMSCKVGKIASAWDLIFEETDRFRVLRDKKDGTREVMVVPKDSLTHWKVYATEDK